MDDEKTTGGPAIGKDEWVARSGERRSGRGGIRGKLDERLAVVPWWTWLALFAAVVALLPVGFESGYVRRIAFDTLIYVLLALGLNVVVGWGGLLDLGYVAFFGVGAYTYALLSSDKFDIHLPFILSLPLAAIVGALVGLLVGLPSRRLLGDYLAIVTLFFFQIFLTVSNNSDNVAGRDVAGGPNGLINIDPLSIFGHQLKTSTEGIFNAAYLYVALAMFLVVYVALRLVDDSRTGRAWRSLREDPLAAEMMGMPVKSVEAARLLVRRRRRSAFRLAGDGAERSVFPQTFEFPLLITVYTMVILGGAGSQAGVVIGAVSISVLLEVLREPGDARFLFYVVGLVTLVTALKLSVRLAAVLGGTLALGFALHALAGNHDGAWTGGVPNGGGRLAGWVDSWVIIPKALAGWISPASYIALICVVLGLTLVHGRLRLALLVPTLYLAAFVWENVMLVKPEPTRFVLLGAILVGVMGRSARGAPRRETGGDRLMTALLELKGISMNFGGLAVIDNLDLHVDEGEIVSVIGPNGAGKTTLFNLVTGVYEPTAGDIVFAGESLNGLPPHKITRKGIARTFQTLRLFLNMSVRENVMAAAYGHTKAGAFRSMLRTPGQRREERGIRELAEKRLAFFGDRLMGYRWDQPAYSLSYANRRRLEIARATATNPRLLLLDEPAAGMNPSETHEITELIGKLRSEGGYTILVIEHDMHVVEGISDRVIALDHGIKIAEGSFAEVATSPRVIEAYLGTKAATTK